MTDLKTQADAAHKWWRTLGPIEIEGKTLPGDRAALARLRRCSSPVDAAMEPATAKLFKALGFSTRNDMHLGRAATLAAVLAHVRKEGGGKIALAIGAPPQGKPEDALLKPNRFRALMAARTDDEIMTSFRRVVAMLDRTANVRDLAKLILSWTDDGAGDKARTRFAFEYHGAGLFAPDIDATETTAPEKV
ncbi:MAG: type I-E CRISPR-associated protein Cse2/CasB [Hyphomicrobium sp.]|nr:type I-E CRISPR-associated protein Cse2/CasB [Hyphomicrobium sp.]